ncbi:hypothetical protein BOTBODRAFT_113712 [Botryobasidium botryosum FD-172 SS1]|uniref:Major facilitator superfamily (MFS) profile domain-containing protein n=1 Tax=Botryobasidium botryosum (strain FD-172 SS1) TaxID=930990 RepID=A0A067MJ53_BOTB1|nr:hypothetical protein BOTBODRAFT_113712 [Botryobasidium botryosum FD-172 SS1]
MKSYSACPGQPKTAVVDDRWACNKTNEDSECASSATSVSEESPLLPTNKEAPSDSLPRLQFSLVLLLRLAEPITATVIFPFINELVGDLDITGGNAKAVGYYVGLIESIFFLTEAFFVFQWGRLSDRIGRRPVLLMGLLALALSSPSFGLAKTFPRLVLARATAGALSGNVGVLKSVLAEITTSQTQAFAFACMPITWSVGGTIGPLLGGFLSRPADRFAAFSGKFWVEYPYFLPCLMTAAFAMLCFVVAGLLLEETHPSHADQAAGKQVTITASGAAESPCPPVTIAPPSPTLRDILTRKVMIAMLNFALLAFLDISFAAVNPLFLAAPHEAGGLGLQPAKIGSILTTIGFTNGLIQISLFSRVVKAFGARNVYTVGISCYMLVFAAFPVMHSIARKVPDGEMPLGVWVVLVLQLSLFIVSNMAWGCISIFVISSAPSRHAMGATNGLSQTLASLARAIGPAGVTSLFALTLERNLLGGLLVYVVFIAITLVAVSASVLLPKHAKRQFE